MGIFDKFRKKKVIDLRDLEKQGRIRIPKQVQHSFEKDKKGYVTIRGNSESDIGNVNGEGALGFLGSLAGASSAQADETSEESSAPTQEIPYWDEKERRRERIKRKFEEMETKIDVSARKLHDILNRMELLERKIERLERRNVEKY